MSRAGVDIGTNTMRLLIVDDDGSERIRLQQVTGLGEGLDATGSLGEEPMERTLTVLDEYGELIAEAGCDPVRVVATAASRDADNGPEFIDRVTVAVGTRPVVISGEDEARLAYRGAMSRLDPPDGAHPLVIDIGGGSTEFVDADRAESVRIGSVRLTDRALEDRPAPFESVEEAAAIVSDLFEGLDLPADPWLVGVAGTWTSIAGLLREKYVVGEMHGTVVTRLELDRLLMRLAPLDIEQTGRLPGFDPARARVILGGVVIAREALRRCDTPEVVVSEADLLDALVIA